MISSEFVTRYAQENEQKIVMLVMDGLGGMPGPNGKTELESAKTPNMDELAKGGAIGLIDPIAQGMIPGSGPAHFALFGYDPVKNDIGRGALAATGIGFDLRGGDVAARINFCTVDSAGLVTDRRAGRIATEVNAKLCEKLSSIKISGVEIFVKAVKDHRAVIVFRGSGLSEHVGDTDPQNTGLAPLEPKAVQPQAEKTAKASKEFLSQAKEILKNEHPANMVLLRGFAECPSIPSFLMAYKLKAAAIATYPDYKGVARVCGMDVLETGSEIEDEIKTLETAWAKYTFFFIHIKKTDSNGEDGNFDGKVKVIEAVDNIIPRIIGLRPDCLVITGDHSTPAVLKAHSHHPVPILFWGKLVRPDLSTQFGERACMNGGLGRFPSSEIMALAMANAQKLGKFGA